MREKPEPLTVPEAINHVWSMDFMRDKLEDCRNLRLFNVIDDSFAIWMTVTTVCSIGLALKSECQQDVLDLGCGENRNFLPSTKRSCREWHIPDEERFLDMQHRFMGPSVVRAKPGDGRCLSLGTVVGIGLLEVQHTQANQVQNIDWRVG